MTTWPVTWKLVHSFVGRFAVLSKNLWASHEFPTRTSQSAAARAGWRQFAQGSPECRDSQLGNFLRRLTLPRDVQHWSLTTLRETLVKIGAKVTRHSKYVTFQLAEVAVPRRLFATILDRIAQLAIPPPSEPGWV